jgi:hypothetical protein
MMMQYICSGMFCFLSDPVVAIAGDSSITVSEAVTPYTVTIERQLTADGDAPDVPTQTVILSTIAGRTILSHNYL